MGSPGAGCFRVRAAPSLCLVVIAVSFTFTFAESPGVSDDRILIGSCSAGPARFLGNQTVLAQPLICIRSMTTAESTAAKSNSSPSMTATIQTKPGLLQTHDQRGRLCDGLFGRYLNGQSVCAPGADEKIPVVGLFAGAQMLYEPLKRYIINMRASYYDETRERVDNFWNLNLRKIGLIYQDDAFGKTMLDGLKLALQKHNSTPVALGSFSRTAPDLDASLKDVMAALSASGANRRSLYSGRFHHPAHAAGWRPQFLTVSFVGTEEFIREAVPDAEMIGTCNPGRSLPEAQSKGPGLRSGARNVKELKLPQKSR